MQESILSCKKFDTPEAADAITLTLSFSARPIIIFAEAEMHSASAIEVPPNFNVSILLFPNLFFPKFFRIISRVNFFVYL